MYLARRDKHDLWQHEHPIWWALGLLLVWWMALGWFAPAWGASSAAPEAAREHPAPASEQPAPAQADSYRLLAELLENDATRERFIQQLRVLAASEGGRSGAPARADSEGGEAARVAGEAVFAADEASPVPADTSETGEPAPDSAEAEAAEFAGASPGTLSARIADMTQEFVRIVGGDVQTAMQMLGLQPTEPLAALVAPSAPERHWQGPLIAFLLVVVATLFCYGVLRLAARGVYRFLDRRVARTIAAYLGDSASTAQAGSAPSMVSSGSTAGTDGSQPDVETLEHLLARSEVKARLMVLYRKLMAMVGALIIDIFVVVLAAVIGHALGVFAAEVVGISSRFEVVFINAFMGIEIVKALARGVFAVRFPYLRLFSMRDTTAAYWYRFGAVIISVAGYGVLVVVPLIRSMISPAAAHVAGLIIMLSVYVYALGVILRNRVAMRDAMRERAEQMQSALFGSLLRMLARSWHVLAIAYFTVLLIATQVEQETALPMIAEATVQTLVAVGGSLLVSGVLSVLLMQRIRLPADLQQRLPLLEGRINAYIPAFIHGLRLLVFVVAALVVLDAWQVLSLAYWLESEAGRKVLTTLVHVGIVLVLAACSWVVVASLIEHRLSRMPDSDMTSARRKTLLSLFRNAAMIVIATLTVMVVLSQIGIDIGPLVAGAGVVGLAVGFGAQKLVQDIITGVFIQIENGMNQNDVVEVAGIFGTVEKLTLRSVGIRTLDGGFHLIPFSAIDKVSNHMRDFSYHLGHYTVAYREDVDEAMHYLRQAFEELKQDPQVAPAILEDISIPGVTTLDERGFTIRVMIKTAPGMQWAVQRAYNRLVKKHFAAAGIELPYPHTVVYFGQDKQGHAPPVRVQAEVSGADDPAKTRSGPAYPDGNAPAPGHASGQAQV